MSQRVSNTYLVTLPPSQTHQTQKEHLAALVAPQGGIIHDLDGTTKRGLKIKLSPNPEPGLRNWPAAHHEPRIAVGPEGSFRGFSCPVARIFTLVPPTSTTTIFIKRLRSHGSTCFVPGSIVDHGLHGLELHVACERAHFQIIDGRDCGQRLIHAGEYIELDQLPRTMVPNCPDWLWGRRVPVPGKVDELLRFRVERCELLGTLLFPRLCPSAAYP